MVVAVGLGPVVRRRVLVALTVTVAGLHRRLFVGCGGPPMGGTGVVVPARRGVVGGRGPRGGLRGALAGPLDGLIGRRGPARQLVAALA
jgi:hypothetical protein